MKLIYCFANNGWCDTCPHARFERTCRGHPYRFFVGNLADALGISEENLLFMLSGINIEFDPENRAKRVSKDDLSDLLSTIKGTETGDKLAMFLRKTYSTGY